MKGHSVRRCSSGAPNAIRTVGRSSLGSASRSNLRALRGGRVSSLHKPGGLAANGQVPWLFFACIAPRNTCLRIRRLHHDTIGSALRNCILESSVFGSRPFFCPCHCHCHAPTQLGSLCDGFQNCTIALRLKVQGTPEYCTVLKNDTLQLPDMTRA